MSVRLFLTGVLLFAALLGPVPAAAAPPSVACGPAATTTRLAGTFPATLPFPQLQATLVGLTGSYTGHVVLQPVAAPPPALAEGCQENSHFVLTGFTGRLIATLPQLGTVVVLDTGPQPINATLELHLGAESNRPLLTFRSDRPVATIFGVVQFVQIVGGQVVHSR